MALSQKIIEGKLAEDHDNGLPVTKHKHFNLLLKAMHHTEYEIPEITNPISGITPDEVVKAKIGWRNAAPGPDGTSSTEVAKTDNTTLAYLFNIITISGLIPSRFKKSAPS